jgi:hypothetical protein
VPSRRILLVTDAACCKATGDLAGQVRGALARQAEVRLVAASAPTPRAQGESPSEVVRAALQQAHTHYVQMRMDRARKDLQRALDVARQTMALGLTPDDLARIHLYLAAVSHAEHRAADVVLNSEAAVAYVPDLQPDPDVFSPPVRAAIEKAQAERQALDTGIVSEPSGATVYWDGVQRGPAPVELKHESRGEHYLRVEHPLCQPWEEVIRLSTSAVLRVTLKLAAPEQSAAVVHARPDLLPLWLQILDADAVVLLSEEPGALKAEARSPSGTTRTVRLPAGSSPEVVYSAARGLLAGSPPRAGRAVADTPPASPRTISRWRRYWWLWTLAGVGVVATGVAVPLAVSSGGHQNGRGARLELP